MSFDNHTKANGINEATRDFTSLTFPDDLFEYQPENTEERYAVKDLSYLTSDEVFILMHSISNMPAEYLQFFSKGNITGEALSEIESPHDLSSLGIIISKEWELNIFSHLLNFKAHGVPLEKIENCTISSHSKHPTILNCITSLRLSINSKRDLYQIEDTFDIIILTIKDNRLMQQLLGSIFKIEINLILLTNSCINYPILCKKFCHVLSYFTINNEQNNIKFGNAGANELIITILRTHMELESIRESTAEAVKCLSYQNDSNNKKLYHLGVCELILKSLKLSILNLPVITTILSGIRNLAFYDDFREKFAEMNGCEAILEAVSKVSENPEGAQAGYWAIYNLCFSECNRRRLLQHNICQLLHNTLLVSDSLSPDVLIPVCRVCYILTCTHPNNNTNTSNSPASNVARGTVGDDSTATRKAFVQLGTPLLLFQVISMHTCNPPVIEWAIKGFLNLAMTGLTDGLNERLLDGNITDILTTILVVYSTSSTSSGDDSTMTSTSIVRAASPTPVSISSATSLSLTPSTIVTTTAPSFQKPVTAILVNTLRVTAQLMVCSAEYVHQFYRNDVMSHIVGILEGNMTHAALCQWSCDILYQLCQKCPEYCAKLVIKIKHFDIFIDILKTHLYTQMKVVTNIVKLLTILINYDHNHEYKTQTISKLSDGQYCELMVLVIWTYLGKNEVIDVICEAVACITAKNLDNNTIKLINAGICEVLVNLLHIHRLQPITTRLICIAIQSIFSRANSLLSTTINTTNNNSNNLQMLFSPNSMCEILLMVLQLHVEDPSVTESVFSIFYYLIDSHTNHHEYDYTSKLISLNLFEILIKSMDKHKKNGQVLLAGTELLVNMSQHEIHCQKLVEFGVSDVLVTALDTLRLSTVGIDNICNSIFNIAMNDQHRIALGKAGVCDILPTILRSNIHLSEEMTTIVLRTVCAVTVRSHANCMKFVSNEGIEAVISSMGRFTNGHSLVEWGLKSVTNIVMECQEIMSNICNVQFCDTVLNSVLTNINTPSVAELCCKLIIILCEGNNATNMKNKQELGGAGICELLLGLFRVHISIHNITSIIFQAMCAVASENENNIKVFRRSSILTLCIQSLRIHGTSPVTIEWACQSILVIGIAGIQLKYRDLPTETLETLLSLLRNFIDFNEIVVLICRILRKFAEDQKTVMRIGELGGCEVMVTALITHSNNDKVLEKCLILMALLASNETNRLRIGGHGGCEAVISALKEYSENGQVVSPACRTLSRLIINNPQNRDRFMLLQVRKLLNDLIGNSKLNEAAKNDARDANRALS